MSLPSEGGVWVPVFFFFFFLICSVFKYRRLEAKASGGVVGDVLNRC